MQVEDQMKMEMSEVLTRTILEGVSGAPIDVVCCSCSPRWCKSWNR